MEGNPKANHMRIWKLIADVTNFDSVMPVDLDLGYESHIDEGKSMADDWKPIELQRAYTEEDLPMSDFPYFYGSPVMSDRAISVLSPIMKDAVEYLQLIFDEKEYSMVNVVRVLNVIDYDKAKYVKFSNGNKILAFQKYSFRMCDELLNNDIFKLVDESSRDPFVSDRFKQTVEDNHLTGFKFELVWDSGE